jgi:hypothetical protein
MKNGWKITYLIVCGTMKYDRNTAHTKRVKYDKKQPFTTGLISPGFVLNIFSKHLIVLKTKNMKKEFDEDFAPSIVLNLCSMFAGLIGFGRPYYPVIIYFIGFILTALVSASFYIITEYELHLIVGYIQWAEKLSLILSIVTPQVERYGLRIRRNTENYGDRIRSVFTMYTGVCDSKRSYMAPYRAASMIKITDLIVTCKVDQL